MVCQIPPCGTDLLLSEITGYTFFDVLPLVEFIDEELEISEVFEISDVCVEASIGEVYVCPRSPPINEVKPPKKLPPDELPEELFESVDD